MKSFSTASTPIPMETPAVKDGGPPLQGKNMSEKRQHFLREHDWIRPGLLFEPRGMI